MNSFAMCLMNKEGEVVSKYPKIYNTRRGFDYFVKIVEEARVKKGFKRKQKDFIK